MITKVAFIAHPTRNVKETKHFYGEVLGLATAVEIEDLWIEFATPRGDTIALDTFSPKELESASVYMALETDDIEAEMRRLGEQGVAPLREAWENKDERGQPICKMAIIADPEGNMIMLHEIAKHRAEE